MEGRQQTLPRRQIRAVLNTVDRNYSETAGVALPGGRAFTDIDHETTAPSPIVNEKDGPGLLARRAPSAIASNCPAKRHCAPVVGIARTANYTSWGEPPQPCVYVPLAQDDSEAMVLYVRTRRIPGMLAPVDAKCAPPRPKSSSSEPAPAAR